jgi:hypothetical protein
MAYVFGSGFVCKDDAAAKKVAFNKDVMMNCVTLAGDLFNPSGTLTGGARAKGNSVLLRLNALVVRSHDLGFPWVSRVCFLILTPESEREFCTLPPTCQRPSLALGESRPTRVAY